MDNNTDLLIKTFTEDLLNTLKDFRKNNIAHQSFDIDCDKLDDYREVDIRKAADYMDLFAELKASNTPTLYWIEILSDTCNEAIYERLNNYTINRSVTSKKSKCNTNTRTLYVGKVKNGFWGRVITHLGYNKSVNTQGLQLYHWTNNAGLKLRFNYISFSESMVELISIYEILLAKELKPLLGTKHG